MASVRRSAQTHIAGPVMTTVLRLARAVVTAPAGG